MHALVTTKRDSKPTAEVLSIPRPNLHAGELLVRVVAVALNPVDAFYVAHPISERHDRVVGSDFSGEVVEIGEGVTGWKVGDRAAAFVQGACSTNDRPGAFAEYATTPADLAFHIPSNASYEDAAALPLCSLTSAQALCISLGLPAPFHNSLPAASTVNETSPAILIYGASTTIGLYGIQLARLLRTPSGDRYRLYGTASTRNHDSLCALGLDGVVDYRSATWAEELKSMSGGISYAYDCLSEGDTTGRISETFVPSGGRIAVIRAAAWDASLVREGVTARYRAVWTGLGVEIGYNGNIIPAEPATRQFTTDFYKFLSAGSPEDPSALPIKPTIRRMPGGLSRIVPDGFELLGTGKVGERTGGKQRTEEWMKPISAEKLVYTISESG